MASRGEIPRKHGIRESGAGHTRMFPKFVPFCPFRFRRAKWSRPMQITAPRRPSFSLRVGGPIDPPRSYVPITAPIRASKRCPDQGTTNITTHRPKFVTTLWLGLRSRPYQKVSEICPVLPVQVSEDKMKPTDADHPPRPSFSLLVGRPIAPPRYYVPITAPIRAGKRRPDQGTTNTTTHRPKFATTLWLGLRTSNSSPFKPCNVLIPIF